MNSRIKMKTILTGVLSALILTSSAQIIYGNYSASEIEINRAYESTGKVMVTETKIQSNPDTLKFSNNKERDLAGLNTRYAKFIGEIKEKQGDQWYHIETKYTKLYFYNDAVKMEWIVEEIDDIYEYVISFRDTNWDGYKISIFFLGEDNRLTEDPNYYTSGYDGNKRAVTMSADFASTRQILDHEGKTIEFKEDPRLILTHELSHHVNKPKYINILDMWLDEALAYYIAYKYPFKAINNNKFPDESKIRILSDMQFYKDNKYDLFLGIDNLFKQEFPEVNDKTKRYLLSFEGIAKAHYRLEEGIDSINKRIIEASIVDFLIEKHGKEKLLALYDRLHEKKSDNYRLENELFAIYCLSLDELEHEWREYIGATEIYDNLF